MGTFDLVSTQFPSRWRWTERIPSLSRCFGRSYSVAHKERIVEKSVLSTPLRRVLRLLAFSLMLLGLVEFIALACGVLFSFLPNEAADELDGWKPASDVSPELSQWPTDFSADIHPVACHSHNDYWRKEPLFSALKAGCSGVEADVWLYGEELYVGHTSASLSPQRTLRSLYIDPLVKILDQQNPITSFHPSVESPRSGVFDTKPAQTLVLLIDFKNDGAAIWPYVADQLGPLRQKKLPYIFQRNRHDRRADHCCSYRKCALHECGGQLTVSRHVFRRTIECPRETGPQDACHPSPSRHRR